LPLYALSAAFLAGMVLTVLVILIPIWTAGSPSDVDGLLLVYHGGGYFARHAHRAAPQEEISGNRSCSTHLPKRTATVDEQD
jgi:hypothetical protein